MIWRLVGSLATVLYVSAWLSAESVGSSSDGRDQAAGQHALPVDRAPMRTGGSAVVAVSHERPANAGTRVTSGSGVLPNEHGQIWREYDIRPYTSRVDNEAKPEQAIVDWILRETGTQTWFSDPLGILSARRDTLRVYHTGEVQAIVSDIVDRFLSGQAQTYVFGLRFMTIGSPNWRAKAHKLLRRPIAVQTPGIDAWVLPKEDAAILVADLRKRSDAVEHGSPNVLLRNGQTHTIQRMLPMAYIRSLGRRGVTWPNLEIEMGQLEEGFTLQFSPLLSQEDQAVDAVLKFNVMQVEKFASVWIDVPTTIDTRQRTQIQVPQTSSWQLHERFRWPADHVLLISCGLVAAPAPSRAATGVSAVFSGGAKRADALLLVEAKGPASKSSAHETTNLRTGSLNYRGRY